MLGYKLVGAIPTAVRQFKEEMNRNTKPTKRGYLIRFYDTKDHVPYYLTGTSALTRDQSRSLIFNTANSAKVTIQKIKDDHKNRRGFFYLTKCFFVEGTSSWRPFEIKKLTRNYIYDFIDSL